MKKVTFAIGSALCSLALNAGAQQQKQPNIILIMTDDMGYSDIGCYGGIISTPNLDRLADNGLQYMQFYNTARSCPTRASLLTGLHPHQAGIGHMTNDRGQDGYRGDLNRHCVTIAEALKPAGYENYMVGKWHVTSHTRPQSPSHNWPIQRGFDHFYGTLVGGGSYYDPFGLCRDNRFITVENDPLYKPQQFYYTNAIGDNAVMFLDEHRQQRNGKPFFMYMAFTAAHWPMQAPEEDIKPYKGKFDKGWDKLREEKYKQMVKAGIIRPEWKLSEDRSVRAWDDVQDKAFELRCMEVYAATVSNMDRNVGKVVEALKKNGQLDNTIIIFLQDNGGCAENFGRDPKQPVRVAIPEGQKLEPMGKDELQTRLVPYRTRDGRPVYQGMGAMPGGPDVFVGYGKGWAHLSDTPFKEYKHWMHEGGIATPLIVHWPAGIAGKGERRWQPGQLPDIMATCVEAAGATYPSVYRNEEIYPCEGKSLVSSFRLDNPADDRYLFWEHEGNRAVRHGKWKLVYKAVENSREIPLSAWELYDLEKDRTETNDLATQHPDLVADLAAQWEQFAVRCHVKPWPNQGKKNK